MLVLLTNRRLELLLFLRTPATALGLDTVALDGRKHRSSLLTAHHRDARIRPHPQHARTKCAATHAVITSTKAAANDHGEFRHLCGCDGSHHLCTVACNTFVLVFATDHEAGYVLQKHEGDFALTAQLDKVRALQCRFGEQDAVVGDNADWHAMQMCEATY